MLGNASKIEIAIEVDDNGSVKIRQLGTEAEKASKKGKESFDKMGTSVGGLNTSLAAGVTRVRSFAAAWTGFIAVFAGAGAIGSLGSLAADYENSLFSMSKTFGDRTDYMISKAKQLSEQINKYYDFNQVAYAFTKTADSMQRYGITGEKYLGLVQRAADVGAAKNLDLKESIDRLESAMRGEAEASEYLGVTLNDTYMKNIALGGAFRDTWEKMSDLEKTSARYNELLVQTEKYQGSAKEAADTLSGSLKSLWSTIKDRLNPSLKETGQAVSAFAANLRDALAAPLPEQGLLNQLRAIDEQITQIEEHHKWLKSAGVPTSFGALMGGKTDDQLSALKAQKEDLEALYRAGELHRKTVAMIPGELPSPPDNSAANESIRLEKELKARAVIEEKELSEEKLRAYIEESNRQIAIEQQTEERAAAARRKVWEEKFGKDFWQTQAEDRYEVQSRSLEILVDEEEAAAQRMRDVFSPAVSDMADALTELEMTGKISFKSLTDSIIRDMLRMANQAAASQVFEFLISTVATVATSYYGGTTTSGAGAAPAHVGAGGTTAFSMAGGGYLGEDVVGIGRKSGSSYEFHEDEIIGPRSKMGGGRSLSITVAPVIQMPAGSSRDDGERAAAVITAQVKSVLANELRPGGMLARY